MPDESTPAMDTRPPYLSASEAHPDEFPDRWGDGPIPPRIDKSALDTYSGATQSQLMSTSAADGGFVDQEGQVLPALREAIKDPIFRRTHLTELGTPVLLRSRSIWQGRTRPPRCSTNRSQRMATTGPRCGKRSSSTWRWPRNWGLPPTSPHFRPPKQSATPPSRRRLRVDPEAEQRIRDPFPTTSPRAPSGEVTTVEIGDLATITITVDAQWMKLPVDTITAMREAIGQLEALATGKPREP